jgi:hypothetical protein
VVPSDFLAHPIAMPTAKSSGSQVKTPLPAAATIVAPFSKPGIAPSMSLWPRRSRMPAAGMTAIGSRRLRPSRCAFAKTLLCFFGVFFSGTSVVAAVLIGGPLVIGWNWSG